MKSSSCDATKEPFIGNRKFDLLLGANALSVTPDRGKEFARHSDVTEYLGGLPFYFPQPHQPWQRGSNENTNGLLQVVLHLPNKKTCHSTGLLDIKSTYLSS